MALDVWMPVGVGQHAIGIEDGDGAAFVAVAALVVAMSRPERCRGGRDLLDPLVQGRLVVLDADDQSDVGRCCDDEMFLRNTSLGRAFRFRMQGQAHRLCPAFLRKAGSLP